MKFSVDTACYKSMASSHSSSLSSLSLLSSTMVFLDLNLPPDEDSDQSSMAGGGGEVGIGGAMAAYDDDMAAYARAADAEVNVAAGSSKTFVARA